MERAALPFVFLGYTRFETIVGGELAGDEIFKKTKLYKGELAAAADDIYVSTGIRLAARTGK